MSETKGTYDPRDYRHLSKTLIKEEAIAYRPSLAKAFGGVTAALFLSQLLYWSDRTRDSDGWIYKSQADMEEETGMTRREQDTARKKLVQAGVLKEERRGLPARMFYQVQWDVLFDKLVAQNRQTGMAESANLVTQKRQSITETTTETTTESVPPEDDFSADAPKSSSTPKGVQRENSTSQSKSRTKPKPSVTPEFREKMKSKHSDAAPADVDDQIDLALSHQSAKKYDNTELYIQNWLRREFQGKRSAAQQARDAPANPETQEEYLARMRRKYGVKEPVGA